jgi:hypothetical protein
MCPINQSPVTGVAGAGCPDQPTGAVRRPTSTSPRKADNTCEKRYPGAAGVVTILDSFTGKERVIRFLNGSSPGKTGDHGFDYTEGAGELQNLSGPLAIEVGDLLRHILLLSLAQLRVHGQGQRLLGRLLR